MDRKDAAFAVHEVRGGSMKQVVWLIERHHRCSSAANEACRQQIWLALAEIGCSDILSPLGFA